MPVDRAVLLFAGLVVLVSLLLAYLVDLRFAWLTAFAGVNLVQAAFTGFCPAALMFRKLGLRRDSAF